MKAVLSLVVPVALLAGCAGTEVKPAAVERPAAFYRGDGSPSSLAEVVAAAKGADAVLMGENHGHPLGLATADRVWEGVLKECPKAGLAMEFFERDEQWALDDYLAGLTDGAGFEKAAKRNPGNYPAGHRSMVEAARAAKRPVVAANAPRRYVSLARKEGFERLRVLTPEQARLFRIPDELPGGKYRENFDKVMTENAGQEGHGGKPKTAEEMEKEKAAMKERLDASFRSQSVWDWTMSESVARSLDAGNIPTVLVVGRFHIDEEGGTVLALRKQRPATRVVTVSFVDAWADALRPEDKGRADYVVYVGPGEE
jgi:uncharacterized iron-regulated protein